MIGLLAYALGIRRRVVLENLQRAFPRLSDRERKQLARRVYAQLGRSLLELWRARRMSDEKLAKCVRFEGWEIYETARARGHGVVVAVAHFGNWELLARACARRGVPLTAITRPLRGFWNRRILTARREGGLRELPDRNATRGALDVLRRGETLAIIVDQNMLPKRGIFVDFFGTPACTTPAAAVLSLRAGAPLIAAFPVRQPDGTHVVHVRGPFETSKTGHAAIEDLTQAVTNCVEEMVRQHPDHWYWLHRRWKTRPA